MNKITPFEQAASPASAPANPLPSHAAGATLSKEWPSTDVAKLRAQIAAARFARGRQSEQGPYDQMINQRHDNARGK